MVEGINTKENVLSPLHSHPFPQMLFLCSQIELCAKDCSVRVAESAHPPQNVF